MGDYSKRSVPMEFPELSPALRAARLAAPKGKVRMVLDTDTYNEVDDQFAVVQWLLSPDRLGIEAIYAAPFHNNRSDGDGDGMQKSYEEILRLLERLDVSPEGFAHRGSTRFLQRSDVAQESAAAHDLVERAYNGNAPLYVVAYWRHYERGFRPLIRSFDCRKNRRRLARRAAALLAFSARV
jgi:purine nucleosidase